MTTDGPQHDTPGAPAGRIQRDPDLIARYARSTAPDERPPSGVAYPTSVEEVVELVRWASAGGTALHPISRGKNWGYGDAAPPTPGQVVVDLSKMNRILEVNEELGYAVIEPGVSQGQLHRHLEEGGYALWPDATGAGLNSSLVGNTLDRGFGHTRTGDHFLNACGMEVVLADGRVLHTGYGHYQDAKAARVYRYGVGPFLDGLFCQSNYGIITKLGVWLMPRPEAFTAFFFEGREDGDLERIVDRLRPLRMSGMLQSTIHLANDLRVASARMRYPFDRTGGQTPLPDDVREQLRRELGIGMWSGIGGLYGTKGSVREAKRAVREALKGLRTVFIDDARLALAKRLAGVLKRAGAPSLAEKVDLVEPVYGLLKGIPSDDALKGASWRVRGKDSPAAVDPLEAHAGMLWASPILPMTGRAAREMLSLIEPIYARHGFEALVTFTMITERAMVAVTNLAFDTREAAEAAQAAACYDDVTAALFDAGFVPYRTGPRGYAKLRQGASVFWEVADQIKAALDPAGTIAPGRYSIGSAPGSAPAPGGAPGSDPGSVAGTTGADGA